MYWSWQLSMNLTIADAVSDSRFGFITTAMPRLRPDGRKSWDGNRIGVSKLHSVTDRLNFYDVSPSMQSPSSGQQVDHLLHSVLKVKPGMAKTQW